MACGVYQDQNLERITIIWLSFALLIMVIELEDSRHDISKSAYLALSDSVI